MKSLSLIVNKIEFRQKFYLKSDVNMKISFIKGNTNQNKNISHKNFIIEHLKNENFSNSIINDKSIVESLEVLKSSGLEIKQFPLDVPLTASSFNPSEKVIQFEYESGDQSKSVNFRINPNLESELQVEIELMGEETIKLKGR